MTEAVIPGDVIASVSGALVVAVIWLARQLALARERVARLEERVHHLEERPA